MNKSVESQRQRYDKEALEHAEHYGDRYTQLYRDKFVRGPLFREPLAGASILDAMSASGLETGYLLQLGAEVAGLDISPNNAAQYMKKWGRVCHVMSIHDTTFDDETFDAVYICGGLHHVLPLLDETMHEIHRILKPGGMFYFVEPNKDTWLNRIRDIWYKRDSRFGDEEEAISYHQVIVGYLDIGFEEKHVHYGGNIAYLLIGQSLALGVPLTLKKYLARPLFTLETLLNKLPLTPRLFFSAAWEKKEK